MSEQVYDQREGLYAAGGMRGKPDFQPVTRTAVWLSSEDVSAAIARVAEAGGDKATCWSLLVEIAQIKGQPA